MQKKANWHRPLRQFHYWASAVVLITAPVVIGSGILLQLKKQLTWVQPPTQKGSTDSLSISFDSILKTATTVAEAEITTWADIDRLDVRPGKGVVKIRANNRWEIQLDSATGEILQSTYRRSDLIESIHDGSFFHDNLKLGLFLPSAIILLLLWLSGTYLFLKPLTKKLAKPKKASI
ncbi:MAG: PepSY domain-containing protein [Verrucomicrobiales bacterium]|nr:PepSY domain-containing protein [Verrucomicrobiales bacterium]